MLRGDFIRVSAGHRGTLFGSDISLSHSHCDFSCGLGMNQEQNARREYVASMYTSSQWKTRVAEMPTDQITAIYLRFIRDGQKPESQNNPVRDIQEETQGRLF